MRANVMYCSLDIEFPFRNLPRQIHIEKKCRVLLNLVMEINPRRLGVKGGNTVQLYINTHFDSYQPAQPLLVAHKSMIPAEI